MSVFSLYAAGFPALLTAVFSVLGGVRILFSSSKTAANLTSGDCFAVIVYISEGSSENPGFMDVLLLTLNTFFAFWLAFFAGAAACLHRDLRRRRLSPLRPAGWSFRSALDVAGVSATAGTLAGLIVLLIPVAAKQHAIPLYSPQTVGIVAGILIFAFLWTEGRRQIQFQRPAGLVFGEWLILAGALQLFETFVFRDPRDWPGVPHGATTALLCTLAIAAGGIWIAAIVPAFLKRYEGLRVIDRIADQGESTQPEYVAATPECPHPERWQMLDAQTAELEVLDFLKALVVTTKPSLIVETGTFIGHSAIKMAEGLKANGFGRIITVEFDPAVFAKARENIEASGLRNWIDYRNQSSLETRVDGVIDILFSDSDVPIREAEIRRFLPQIAPGGLVLAHDASSQFKLVREAALRLEQEGLLSVVLLSTPRGLVVAQKREGRK
jgi:predicted O-methyltransferase YrrM